MQVRLNTTVGKQLFNNLSSRIKSTISGLECQGQIKDDTDRGIARKLVLDTLVPKEQNEIAIGKNCLQPIVNKLAELLRTFVDLGVQPAAS